MSSNLTAVDISFVTIPAFYCAAEPEQRSGPDRDNAHASGADVCFLSAVVLEVGAKSNTYRATPLSIAGTTSVVIRKNWNDTEKISMAPAQG